MGLLNFIDNLSQLPDICIYVHTDGQFSVPHRSDPVIIMHSGDCILTIFCLASNHTIKTSYEWTCNGVTVGVCSPVLYATKPGIYQCVVTAADGNSALTREFDVISGIPKPHEGSSSR